MNTQPRVLKWSLIIGIMIVLNLFFNYTISLVYKSPDYNTYCPQNFAMPAPGSKDEQTLEKAQMDCSNKYQAVQNIYDRNVFTVLVILGILMVLIANFLKGNQVISGGLSTGGVFSFIIASFRYWSNANDITRVVILAIALGLLFWIAVKKFKNQS